jgi:hypothetical protein
MKRIGLLLIASPLLLSHGCATPAPPKPRTLYQSWDQTLDRGNLRTVDDVSMILGSTPTRCDEIEPTRVGTLTGFFLGTQDDPNSTYITFIRPNSPAASAGMAVGDEVRAVNDTKVETAEEVQNALALLPLEAPVSLRTRKNSYTVVFPLPKEARQCYWEISGGAVGYPGDAPLVLPQPAPAGSAGPVHQRFFKTVCRFYDGVLAGCISNWQE